MARESRAKEFPTLGVILCTPALVQFSVQDPFVNQKNSTLERILKYKDYKNNTLDPRKVLEYDTTMNQGSENLLSLIDLVRISS